MIWHILRYWIAFFLPAFYKRIQAKNLQNILVPGPVIIAMNHPNAFTDPILITSLTHPLKLKYLARGDAFRPGFVAWALEAIGLVPIFRIQDGGKEGLKKNEDAYRRVNYLLSKNSKIIVFAEGLCIQERRLRPLKKGVARMVFGAYETLQNDNLVVVPIGVNYSKANKFRSTAFYNIGDPIKIKDFISDYKKHPARTNNTFLQILEPRMRDLITHINDPSNDVMVEQVETLCKKTILRERGLNYKNLEHDFLVLKELTGRVNTAALNKPDLVAEFKSEAQSYFCELKKNKLRDWLFDPYQKNKVNYGMLFVRIIALVPGMTVFLIALAGNYLPFKLSDVLSRRMSPYVEFHSSFAIGLAMVLFLISYLAWLLILPYFLPVQIWPPIFLLIFGFSAWFSLYFYPFLRKTFGIMRVLGRPETARRLGEQRKRLLSLINKF